MLAALDLSTGKLFYRIRPRKGAAEFLELLETLGARWPDQTSPNLDRLPGQGCMAPRHH